MPTDDDTVPVRRETLRLVLCLACWGKADYCTGEETVEDCKRAVREAEAVLGGQDSG